MALTTTETSTPKPTNPSDAGCELISVDRRNITVEVAGATVTVNVPATGDYFDLWDPETNGGTKYGPFALNKDVVVGDFAVGKYDMRLDVEGDFDGVHYQCDRHRIQFEIVGPPCSVEWIEQKFVRENETPYGACEEGEPSFLHTTPPTIDCPGHKTRTVDIVIYEINSCTQEQREKSRTNIEEQAPCVAQCEQAMCHTERPRLHDGRIKWQCQNVPPGTPGHFPGHFNWPHGDFFGPCTSQKCYNITN